MIATAEHLIEEFKVAQRAGDAAKMRAKAVELAAAPECGATGAFHGALCLLLHHGEFATVKRAIEGAIALEPQCRENLLPLLAHTYQRMHQLTTAHEMFEECVRCGFLSGRNAFLTRTADAVAFAAAYETGDAAAIVAGARRFIASCVTPATETFHAAVFALMGRGEIAEAKRAVEQALASDFDACAPLLLPVLAHAHQRLHESATADASHDLAAAHRLFEDCARRGFLSGRNAFLARSADAVAFAAAYESGNPAAIIAGARRFIASCDTPSSEMFHAAVFALLTRGEIAEAKLAIETALAADFEGCAPLLLPVLAHAHQRVYEFETAHTLFQTCRRLGLLKGKNAALLRTATEVAFGAAELAMYRALCAGDLGDAQAETAGMIVTRAIYESAFEDARANAASGAPGIIASATRAPRMPDFVVAGSAKCGTTYLYDLLCNSPSVWKRSPKEIHYFTSMYQFGDAFYSRFFELCPDGLICGEASPDYLDNCTERNRIDERMLEAAPDAKLIVVLRDPALRAVSWYNQMTTNDTSHGGRPGRGTLEGLTMEQLHAYRNGNALRTGHFVHPLRRFVSTFGRKRLLILPFDDILDVEKLCATLSAFLDIEPPSLGEARLRQNSGKHGRPSEDLYNELREYYRDSLSELEQEFGIRF